MESIQHGSYQLHRPDEEGIYESTLFQGLRLDERPYWDFDLKRLLAALSV